MHPDHCHFLIEERLSLEDLDRLRRQLEERYHYSLVDAHAARLEAILDRVEAEIVVRNLDQAA